MEFDQPLKERIEKLAEKYQASGQELLAFLDGLLYAKYITYWDYIHLDALLSLQTPRTDIPDEEIFIMYHQITELYFKLSLHELKQLAEKENLGLEEMIKRLKRINRYFQALTHSFGVMEKGMDREEFLRFRMSLIPASGFQSAQYRQIEIAATDMDNLVAKDKRDELKNANLEEKFAHIYWKNGAVIEETGEKTLTLKQFELKYSKQLIRDAHRFQDCNVWQLYKKLPESDQKNEELIQELRNIDLNVNVNWPLQHYRTAATYLARRPHDIAATGGTNWQKYLPPRFQKRIFYPELWSEGEIEDWGKFWVENLLREVRNENK